MRIISETKLDFKDVMIVPKRSTLRSRSDVDLKRTFTFLHSRNEWTGIPVMAANMDSTGTFEVAAALARKSLITCIDKHFSVEQWADFAEKHPEALPNVAVSSGMKEKDFEKLSEILSVADAGFINLDVANGYVQGFVNFVRKVRAAFPKKNIIAGNVVTEGMVEELLLSGADVVKVGIGPGSVCTTRVKTGVGYPQLSAVIECADAAHGLNGMIVCDGGCTCPGDVSKAFAGGADFVMLGGMFAGHNESGGEEVLKEGKKFKRFYGMSSRKAMTRHKGGVANYRAVEGKEVLIPHKGPINETVADLLGGIRSTCTYVGARFLKELSKRTTFVRVSMQENLVFGRESK